MNIDDGKRSRDALKSYFVKNAIPTEGQFAQLIDSQLNQREDRLVKTPDGPLSIEAAGPDSGPRKVLDFYDNLADAQPTFSIGLRMKPNDARRALAIADGAGNSRLAVEAGSGNLGIGTTEPKQRLDVAGDIGLGGRQALSAPDGWLRLNQAGSFNLGTQASGLFAAGSLNIGGLNNGNNPGGSNAVVAGSLGVGVFAPADRLHVDGRVRAGALTMGPWPTDPGGYAFIGSNLLDQNSGENHALLVGTGKEPGATMLNASSFIGLCIRNTQHVALTTDGNLGIGTISPRAKLEVAGGAIMPAAGDGDAAGILFPPDPFGGTGDRAWIRWLSRGGESTTLEIGVANDADDHIALMPSGNVGIGTRTPGAKLEVAGTLRAQNICSGSDFRIGTGQTAPGDWKQYLGSGIVVAVNTTSAGFTATPRYMTTLGGTSEQWDTTGATSIYNATATGFTVYLRWSNGRAMTVADAVSRGWYIQWIGIQEAAPYVFRPFVPIAGNINF